MFTSRLVYWEYALLSIVFVLLLAFAATRVTGAAKSTASWKPDGVADTSQKLDFRRSFLLGPVG